MSREPPRPRLLTRSWTEVELLASCWVKARPACGRHITPPSTAGSKNEARRPRCSPFALQWVCPVAETPSPGRIGGKYAAHEAVLSS